MRVQGSAFADDSRGHAWLSQASSASERDTFDMVTDSYTLSGEKRAEMRKRTTILALCLSLRYKFPKAPRGVCARVSE